jgi:hypothetical protein
VLLAGLLLVGVVLGCVWSAIPHRPLARDWPLYGLLLLGPYLLAALGCRWSASWLTRLPAVLVVAAGGLIAAVTVFDAWPTFHGDPPPAIPASALAAGVLLLLQYIAGLVAIAAGFTRATR